MSNGTMSRRRWGVSDLSCIVDRVEYGLTSNGYRGLGFDPGEVAWETAPTSKEGSRRATFPMGFSLRTWRNITILGLTLGNRNGGDLDHPPSNNWRTSLVPAPAVIPAPIASNWVVAVKTLVANLGARPGSSSGSFLLAFTGVVGLVAKALGWRSSTGLVPTSLNTRGLRASTLLWVN